jgi:hypothetical protein
MPAMLASMCHTNPQLLNVGMAEYMIGPMKIIGLYIH